MYPAANSAATDHDACPYRRGQTKAATPLAAPVALLRATGPLFDAGTTPLHARQGRPGRSEGRTAHPRYGARATASLLRPAEASFEGEG